MVRVGKKNTPKENGQKVSSQKRLNVYNVNAGSGTG